jgi:hypothetical protein
MKTNTFFKQSILFIAIGLTAVVTTAQAILTVDNNVGAAAAYTTVQAAHDAAAAGDIIYLQPSPTSYGNVTIDKALTIVGRSHSEVSKISLVGTVIIRSSNVILKGLRISTIRPQASGAPVPPPFVGLEIYECYIASTFQIGAGGSVANVILDDVKVRGCFLTGTTYIYNDSTNVLISNNMYSTTGPLQIYNTTSMIIANNIFKFNGGTLNLYNINTTGTAILYNNMFINNAAGASQVIFRNGEFNISNNLTYNYGTGDITLAVVSPATLTDSFTLANMDPLFTNVDSAVNGSFAGTSTYNPANRLEDDLTLQAGSPALTGGGGGSEIGLYSNGFNYKKLGNPKGIPTLDVISYNGAVPKNGSINVTINAKAH